MTQPESSRRPLPVETASPRAAPAALQAFVLALGVGLAAAWQLARSGHGGTPLVATTLCLGLLLVPYWFFGLADARRVLGGQLEGRRARVTVLGLALLTPYLVYGLGTGSFTLRRLATLALFIVGPVTCALFARQPPRRLTWPDALAILALWVPVDFRLVQDVWPWPTGELGYALTSLLGVDLALLLFVVFRQLDGVGYRFWPARGDLRAVGVNVAAFALLAVPIALATEFVQFHPHGTLGEVVGAAFVIFVTIAVPEELLFRGLIQNLLERTWRRPAAALVVSAVVFGAAHLNNGPRPDWRYFVLATLAGLFYGRAYRQTRGLLAAAGVHTAVDAVWRNLFR